MLGAGSLLQARAARATLLARLIAALTPFAALNALTRAFCLGFRLRM